MEFSAKNVSKAALLSQIEATQKVVQTSLSHVKSNDLEQEFPMLVFEKPTSTEYMQIHLTTHLAYHLDQINYHSHQLDD